MGAERGECLSDDTRTHGGPCQLRPGFRSRRNADTPKNRAAIYEPLQEEGVAVPRKDVHQAQHLSGRTGARLIITPRKPPSLKSQGRMKEVCLKTFLLPP